MKSFAITTVIASMGAALVTASACAPPNMTATIGHRGAVTADAADVTAAAKSCMGMMMQNRQQFRMAPRAFETCEVPVPVKDAQKSPTVGGATGAGSTTTGTTGALTGMTTHLAGASLSTNSETSSQYEWVASTRSYWIKKMNSGLYLNMHLTLDVSALPKAKPPANGVVQPIDIKGLEFELADQCSNPCTAKGCDDLARMNQQWSPSGLRLAISYLVDGKIEISGIHRYSSEGSRAPTLATGVSELTMDERSASLDMVQASGNQNGNPGGNQNRAQVTNQNNEVHQNRTGFINPPRPGVAPPVSTQTPAPDGSDEYGAAADADQTLTFLPAPNSNPAESAVVVASWPDRGVFYPRGRAADNTACGDDFPCKFAARRRANEQFCQSFAKKVNEWAMMENPDNAACNDQPKPAIGADDPTGLLANFAMAAGDIVTRAEGVGLSKDSRINGPAQARQVSLLTDAASDTASGAASTKTSNTASGSDVQTFWNRSFGTEDLIPTLTPVCLSIVTAQNVKAKRTAKAAADKAAKEAKEGKPKPVPTAPDKVLAPNANDPMK